MAQYIRRMIIMVMHKTQHPNIHYYNANLFWGKEITSASKGGKNVLIIIHINFSIFQLRLLGRIHVRTKDQTVLTLLDFDKMSYHDFGILKEKDHILRCILEIIGMTMQNSKTIKLVMS